MNVNLSASARVATASLQPPVRTPPKPAAGAQPELREAFDSFVGETLFGQMLKSMRKTVGKPAYFYGGRAEEVFTQQLDQKIAEKLSHSGAQKFSQPMYELFNLRRT
jgi:peptidoglycan hydrolase FlgJ